MRGHTSERYNNGKGNCKECHKEGDKKWRKTPKGKEASHREYLKRKELKPDSLLYKNKTEEQKRNQSASQRKRNLNLKRRVFNHYSNGKCSCCGESEISFLQLDHINDDGNEHRRFLKSQGRQHGGPGLYRDLEKQQFPEGFQVLCANCNQAKRSPEGCPHQRED